MKDLYNLSVTLASMGIFHANLEMSYDRLINYYADIEFSDKVVVIYTNMQMENTDMPPGITIALNGVKIYLNDPKTKFENKMENQINLETIKKVKFPDSSLVASLQYNGKMLLVEFKSNGSVYGYPMSKKYAEEIYGAPSVGKAVLTMKKDITGILQESE